MLKQGDACATSKSRPNPSNFQSLSGHLVHISLQHKEHELLYTDNYHFLKEQSKHRETKLEHDVYTQNALSSGICDVETVNKTMSDRRKPHDDSIERFGRRSSANGEGQA